MKDFLARVCGVYLFLFGGVTLGNEVWGLVSGRGPVSLWWRLGFAALVIVALYVRFKWDASERRVVIPPSPSWSVSQWRSAPDVAEYAEATIGAPFETRLGGLLVAAGLPVGRDLEYKVIVRVKGNG